MADREGERVGSGTWPLMHTHFLTVREWNEAQILRCGGGGHHVHLIKGGEMDRLGEKGLARGDSCISH